MNAVRKKILVIDDYRTFDPEVIDRTIVYARTFDEGMQRVVGLMDGSGADVYDELWLDHDLGWHEETGMPATVRPIVLYMVEEAVIFNRVINRLRINPITSNPVGRDWIVDQLNPYYEVYGA